MSKRSQPIWTPPTNDDQRPVLKLFNSLTRKKEDFKPSDPRQVTWYSCGPTVYDASHMGHARSYISFDILRRILSDYFGHKILYVMNITDIDDKIIKRARQNYLFENYLNEGKNLEATIADATSVISYFGVVIKETQDPDKKTMMEGMFAKVSKSVEALQNAVKINNESAIKECKEELLKAAKDPISEWLDKQYGSTVKDNELFAKLPRYWESEFHKDMKALNIQPADILTRVSEYIPNIIQFIERIIDNGLAYESNGSVYFAVNEFDSRDRHYYARLVPEAYGDTKSLREGEGELTDESTEKRSANDFALWKRSKSGEPSWKSPWGEGRPGWHIECSAMASDVLGDNIDIHTGGVDLKFPHHDNELAQSEAHFDKPGWVNYFLHTGHLTIAGCKMSKSLKNFITIQDALKRHTATQLRLAFLLHSWKDTLDYSDNTMEMAVQTEKIFNEFFLTVKAAIREGHGSGEGGTWGEPESQLNEAYKKGCDNLHKALCDNIDTRSAIDSLREIVSATHTYLKVKDGAPNTFDSPSATLLTKVATYVTDVLHIFGCIDGPRGAIGFPVGKGGSENLEETLLPYLEALSSFRSKVRDAARTVKASEVLTICDDLRDNVLPELGVRLEDKGERSIVKLVDKEQILREREEKRKQELEKERKKKEQLEAQKAKDELKKISPMDMFRKETDKYSQFDDKGLPTHDQSGQELSKGLIKKLQKLQLAQEKKYNEYMATQNAS